MRIVANSSFQMTATRNAIGNGLNHVESQVEALERAVSENPGLAADLSKTLLESTFKTILDERGVPFGKKADLPELFKLAHQCVPVLPRSLAGDPGARDVMSRTLNGLHTAVQGVGEMRSKFGFASHGHGPGRGSLEVMQALLCAQAADTIIGFLYGMHCEDRFKLSGTSLQYEDHADLNTTIDDLNSAIEILSFSGDTFRFQPSEVLFRFDAEAYRNDIVLFEEEQELETARIELVSLLAKLIEIKEPD